MGEEGGGRSIPFQITVHNSEEDLQEQVDGVNQHRQQVQPRLAGHHDGLKSGGRADNS